MPERAPITELLQLGQVGRKSGIPGNWPTGATLKFACLNRYRFAIALNGRLRPAHTVLFGQRAEPGVEESGGVNPG
jgi:hypothetical protein